MIQGHMTRKILKHFDYVDKTACDNSFATTTTMTIAVTTAQATGVTNVCTVQQCGTKRRLSICAPAGTMDGNTMNALGKIISAQF